MFKEKFSLWKWSMFLVATTFIVTPSYGGSKPALSIVTAICSRIMTCGVPLPVECRSMLYVGDTCTSSGVQIWDSLGFEDYENAVDGENIDKVIATGKVKVFNKRLNLCLKEIGNWHCTDIQANTDASMMNIENLFDEDGVCPTVFKPLVPLSKIPCPSTFPPNDGGGSDSGG